MVVPTSHRLRVNISIIPVAIRTKIMCVVDLHFGNRWCKREYVDPNALKEWKVSIFKIVDKLLKFIHKIQAFSPLNLNPLFDI